jgi:hypothetical protein
LHPVVILILIVAVLFSVSWIKRAPPSLRKQITNRFLLGLGAFLLLFLLITGKLHPLFALAGVLISLVPRIMGTLNLARNMKSVFGNGAPRAQGQKSTVSTLYLRMSLHHDTGDMAGEVIKGQFHGRELDALSAEELIQLYEECQAVDEQSATVLEAYLDRHGEPDWRKRGSTENRANYNQDFSSKMSQEEALLILGLETGASRVEIADAHRKLIQKLHPDRGGSTFLAAKINQAKDALLNNKR